MISLALKAPRTPVLPKILTFLTISYAISPLDLIPDFFPILGYLDDIIILPAMIYLSIKLIPNEVMEYCRQKELNTELNKKYGIFSTAIIMLIWIFLSVFIVLKVIPF